MEHLREPTPPPDDTALFGHAVRMLDVTSVSREQHKRQPAPLTAAADVCGVFGEVADWRHFRDPVRAVEAPRTQLALRLVAQLKEATKELAPTEPPAAAPAPTPEPPETTELSLTPAAAAAPSEGSGSNAGDLPILSLSRLPAVPFPPPMPGRGPIYMRSSPAFRSGSPPTSASSPPNAPVFHTGSDEDDDDEDQDVLEDDMDGDLFSAEPGIMLDGDDDDGGDDPGSMMDALDEEGRMMASLRRRFMLRPSNPEGEGRDREDGERDRDRERGRDGMRARAIEDMRRLKMRARPGAAAAAAAAARSSRTAIMALVQRVNPKLLRPLMTLLSSSDPALHHVLVEDPVMKCMLAQKAQSSAGAAAASRSLLGSRSLGQAAASKPNTRQSSILDFTTSTKTPKDDGEGAAAGAAAPNMPSFSLGPSASPAVDTFTDDAATDALVALVELGVSERSAELLLVAAHILLMRSVVTSTASEAAEGVSPGAGAGAASAPKFDAPLHAALPRLAVHFQRLITSADVCLGGSGGTSSAAPHTPVPGAPPTPSFEAAPADDLPAFTAEWSMRNFLPGTVGGTLDPASILFVWLIASLDLQATAYLRLQQDAATPATGDADEPPSGELPPPGTEADLTQLKAATVLPSPPKDLTTTVAPSVSTLLLLRSLVTTLHHCLLQAKHDDEFLFSSTCLSSSLRVLQANMHCVTYHGPQHASTALYQAVSAPPAGAAKSPAFKSPYVSPGLRAISTPMTASPSLRASPAPMLADGAGLSAGSLPFLSLAGGTPPPMAPAVPPTLARASSWGRSAPSEGSEGLSDLYASLRVLLEGTLLAITPEALPATVARPRVDPPAAALQQPTPEESAGAGAGVHKPATRQSRRTSKGSGPVPAPTVPPKAKGQWAQGRPKLAGTPSTARVAIGAALTDAPMMEDNAGWSKPSTPLVKGKPGDDDPNDASSLSVSPFVGCHAVTTTVSREATGSAVRHCALDVWTLGLRVMYATPAQRSLLLSKAVAVVAVAVYGPSAAGHAGMPYTATPPADAEFDLWRAMTVCRLFANQDLAHTCLVSNVPTSAYMRDNGRAGGAAWEARDLSILRLVMALAYGPGPIAAHPDLSVALFPNGTADTATPRAAPEAYDPAVFAVLLSALQRSMTRPWWRPVLDLVSSVSDNTGSAAAEGESQGRRSGGDDIVDLPPPAAPASDAMLMGLGPAVPRQFVPFGVVEFEEKEESPLLLDSARCAECITIGSGYMHARQTMDKSWGVVLASTGFAPNTGTHVWEVKLRRCDRGFLLVGVATREASTSTHLGGDRHGWGMIGSRALWHGRSKSRSGYGRDLRSGMVVRCTLDTDAGTLAFALVSGNSVTNWGTAFRDLSGVGTLYPAISTYQKNDEFLLRRVPAAQLRGGSRTGSASAASPSAAFRTDLEAARTKEAAAAAAWNGLTGPAPPLLVRYLQLACAAATGSGILCVEPPTPNMLQEVFLSLFRVVTQWGPLHFPPSVALRSLPEAHRLLAALSAAAPSDSPPALVDVTGVWELRSQGASKGANIPPQTYHVRLVAHHPGSPMFIGHGFNQFDSSGEPTVHKVAISGAVSGAWIRFAEVWHSSTSCIVTARLSADGNTLMGTYTDGHKGSGAIVGDRLHSTRLAAGAGCVNLHASVHHDVADFVATMATTLVHAHHEECNHVLDGLMVAMDVSDVQASAMADMTDEDDVPPPPPLPLPRDPSHKEVGWAPDDPTDDLMPLLDVPLEDYTSLGETLGGEESAAATGGSAAAVSLGRSASTLFGEQTAELLMASGYRLWQACARQGTLAHLLPSAHEIRILAAVHARQPGDSPAAAPEVAAPAPRSDAGVEERKGEVEEAESKDMPMEDQGEDAPAADNEADDDDDNAASPDSSWFRFSSSMLATVGVWLASPLFSAGLPPPIVPVLVRHFLTVIHDSPLPAWVTSAALPDMPLPDSSLATALEFPPEAPTVATFIADMLAGSGAAAALDKALLSKVGNKNVIMRRAKPFMHAARRAVILAHLHHIGKLEEVAAACAAGTDVSGDADIAAAWSVSQSAVLKARTEAHTGTAMSNRVFTALYPGKELTSGVKTETAMDTVTRRAVFLLGVSPAASMGSDPTTIGNCVIQFVGSRLNAQALLPALRWSLMTRVWRAVQRSIGLTFTSQGLAMQVQEGVVSYPLPHERLVRAFVNGVRVPPRFAVAKSMTLLPKRAYPRDSSVASGVMACGPNLANVTHTWFWSVYAQIARTLSSAAEVKSLPPLNPHKPPVLVPVDPSGGHRVLVLLSAATTVLSFSDGNRLAEGLHVLADYRVFDAIANAMRWAAAVANCCHPLKSDKAASDGPPAVLERIKAAVERVLSGDTNLRRACGVDDKPIDTPVTSEVDMAHVALVRDTAVGVFFNLATQALLLDTPSTKESPDANRLEVTPALRDLLTKLHTQIFGVLFRLLRWCNNELSAAPALSTFLEEEGEGDPNHHPQATTAPHIEALTFALVSMLYTVCMSAPALKTLASGPWLRLLFAVSSSNGASSRLQRRVLRVLRRVLPRTNAQAVRGCGVIKPPSTLVGALAAAQELDALVRPAGMPLVGTAVSPAVASDGDVDLGGDDGGGGGDGFEDVGVPMVGGDPSLPADPERVVTHLLDIIGTSHQVQMPAMVSPPALESASPQPSPVAGDGDGDVDAGSEGGSDGDDEARLLAQALALSMAEEDVVETPMPSNEEATAAHGSFLAHSVTLLTCLHEFSSELRAASHSHSAAVEAVHLLRQLHGSPSWGPVVQAGLDAALKDLDAYLQGDLDALGVAKGPTLPMDDADAVTKLGKEYLSCGTRPGGYTPRASYRVRSLGGVVQLAQFQTAFSHGYAALSVIGGHTERLRLGGCVRKQDSSAWGLPADDSHLDQAQNAGSGQRRTRGPTAAQLAVKASTYDTSLAGAMVATLPSKRPASSSKAMSKPPSNNSFIPGQGFGDAMGVDIMSELPEQGACVGVLVGFPFGEGGEDGSAPFVSLGPGGDVQAEVGVRGPMGSAYIVRMQGEDAVPVDELPALPELVPRGTVDTLVNRLVRGLLTPILDEEQCDDDDSTRPDSAPPPAFTLARDYTTSSSGAAEGSPPEALPVAPLQLLGADPGTAEAPPSLPLWMAELGGDTRVNRAILRVHAMKAASHLLNHRSHIQIFVDAVLKDAGVVDAMLAGDDVPAGDSDRGVAWSLFQSILRRACCTTRTAGLCDVEDVEAAWMQLVGAYNARQSARLQDTMETAAKWLLEVSRSVTRATSAGDTVHAVSADVDGSSCVPVATDIIKRRLRRLRARGVPIPATFSEDDVDTYNSEDEGSGSDTDLPYSPPTPSGEGVAEADGGDSGEKPASDTCLTMMDMGFPRAWCELALERCQGSVTTACNFLFEHEAEMDDILAAHLAAKAAANSGSRGGPPSSHGGNDNGSSAPPPTGSSAGAAARSTGGSRGGLGADEAEAMAAQLEHMGFPPSLARRAVTATGSFEASVAWILQHGDLIHSDGGGGGGDPFGSELALGLGGLGLHGLIPRRVGESGPRRRDRGPTPPSPGPTGEEAQRRKDAVAALAKPYSRGRSALKMVCGLVNVTPSLDVSGIPNAGFASVGANNVMLTSGRWYYEVVVKTAGLAQVGWADGAFTGCNDRGEGVGDDSHSWAFDGNRVKLWSVAETSWGTAWKPGDVIGCLLDMDNAVMSFSRNGSFAAPMGDAFVGFKCVRGLYPCVSLSGEESLTFNFGGSRGLVFPLPAGARPIHAAFRQCPAPHLGLSRYGIGRVGSKALSRVVADRLEQASAVAAMNERHFAAAGGGRGFGRAGWAGGVDDFSEGGPRVGPNGEMYRSRFSFGGGNIHTLGEAAAELQYASDPGLRRMLLMTAHVLTILHCRRIAVAAMAITGTPLLRSQALMSAMIPGAACRGRPSDDDGEDHPAPARPREDGSEDGGNSDLGPGDRPVALVSLDPDPIDFTCASGIVSVLKLVAWKGLGLPQRECAALYKQSVVAVGDPVLSYPRAGSGEGGGPPTHAVQLLEPAFRHGLLAAYEQYLGRSPVSPPFDDLADKDPLPPFMPAGEVVPPELPSAPVPGVLPVDGLPPLVLALFGLLESELVTAAHRDYTNVQWKAADHDGAPCITAGLLDLAETNTWSDIDADVLPNAILATWVTFLLMELVVLHRARVDATWAECPALEAKFGRDASAGRTGARLSGRVDHDIAIPVFNSWCIAMRSPNTNLKEMAARAAAAILREAIDDARVVATAAKTPGLTPQVTEALEVLECSRRGVLGQYLRCLSLDRLEVLVVSRMNAERHHLPVQSLYLQSLLELTTTAHNASLLCPPHSAADALAVGLMAAVADISLEASEKPAQPVASESKTAVEEAEAKDGDGDGDGGASAPAPLEDLDMEGGPAKLLPVSMSPISTPAPFGSPVPGSLDHLLDEGNTLVDSHAPWKLLAEGGGFGPELGVLGDMGCGQWAGSVHQRPSSSTETSADETRMRSGVRVIRGPSWHHGGQDGGKGSVGTVEMFKLFGPGNVGSATVRWPSGSRFSYRWGVDGSFDITMVEVDDEDKVVRELPHPPVAPPSDQPGFGVELHMGFRVSLMVTSLPLQQDVEGAAAAGAGAEAGEDTTTGSVRVAGVVEWPLYNARVGVDGWWHPRKNRKAGRFVLVERELVAGNPCSGWLTRFGHEHWRAGTELSFRTTEPVVVEGDLLSPTVTWPSSFTGSYRIASGSAPRTVVNATMDASSKLPFTFDKHAKGRRMDIQKGGMSVTGASSGEMRAVALGNVGWTSGVHYWEVHIDSAEHGSIFIGVAPRNSSPGVDPTAVLSRWPGWGFVNFRATFHAQNERVYGEFFSPGDVIGVKLDMDRGTLAFFLDGMRFGEHFIADLGTAFDNLNDSGGGVRPARAVYPAIGVRHGSDKATMTTKWLSLPGSALACVLKEAQLLSVLLPEWGSPVGAVDPSVCGGPPAEEAKEDVELDVDALADTTDVGMTWSQVVDSSATAFTMGAYQRWLRWSSARYQRVKARGGLFVDVDTSPAAFKAVGSTLAAGQRVRVTQSNKRALDTPEEAIVLGVYMGNVWYRVDTVSGSDGSNSAAALAWYWLPDEQPFLEAIPSVGGEGDKEEPEFVAPTWTLMEFCRAVGLPVVGDPRPEVPAPDVRSDRDVCTLANQACNATGVDPINLKPAQLLAHWHKVKGSLPADNPLVALPDASILARYLSLLHLNQMVIRVLPYVSLSPRDDIGWLGAGAGSFTRFTDAQTRFASGGVDPAGVAPSGLGRWTGASLGRWIRARRHCLFHGTKMAFWDSVLAATTTATPLSPDEYEDPREIRAVRVNRGPRAQAKVIAALKPGQARIRRSVFGQLFSDMRSWADAALRRAYVGKGHGGQKRAFKVKLLGEGVNDYGGPYRAVFEHVMDELQCDSEFVQDGEGRVCLLPLLLPSPNRGDSDGVFVMNPSCDTAKMLDYVSFLGRLVGIAVRHGMQLSLSLPRTFWASLARLRLSAGDIAAFDVAAAEYVQALLKDPSTLPEGAVFEVTLSDGSKRSLVPGGKDVAVNAASADAVKQYAGLVASARLRESEPQMRAFYHGLASVLPVEVLHLFNAEELEALVCGAPDVNVEFLKSVTVYGEGVSETDAHVVWLWEVLEEFSPEDRAAFLRFVLARSRLPRSANYLPMPFTMKPTNLTPDALPTAQTCFFSMELPRYPTKDALRDKLLYAIHHSPNMDADVRLHNAEGWADL